MTLGAAAAAAAAGLAWATYPAVGRLIYRAGAAAESRLRGFRTGHAEVEGRQMAYYEGGRAEAPTVMLVHGFSADRDVWARFGSHLLDGYRVLIPDLLGHGETGFVGGADYSAPAQAARVGALLDELRIDQVHIMGNSMGGFVAAHFAAAHPERTLSLGLCDASGVEAPVPSALDRMLEEGHNPFLLTDPGQFDAFYAMTMAMPPYLPRPVLDAKAQDYVERREELAEVFVGQHGRNTLDDRLADITAPTLVMWGEEDPLVDISAAHVWAQGLSDATLVVYDGIGHMPMVETPVRSAADYARFLQSTNT